MKRQRTLTALQLVLLFMAGSLIAAATFLLIGVLNLHGSTGATFWMRALLSLSPLALGFYISVRAESRLKAGIATLDFPRDDINSLRGSFESVLWGAFSIGLMFAGIFIMFRNEHPHTFGWFLFALGQSLTRLPSIIRERPADRQPSSPWNNALPLRSDHWGSR
jgi:hypothetical protein